MTITSLDDLIRSAVASPSSPKLAIARSGDIFVLEAAMQAYSAGLLEPVLIGDQNITRRIAHDLSLDISSLRCIHLPDDEAAVREAVRMYREGEAALIMKGAVSTSTLLKAVLDKTSGVPPQGILSHVTVFENPASGKLMLLSDAAVNIRPNLQRKVEILRNALNVARALGMTVPRAAMLAATEKVNYPAMPATLDADLIARMGQEGAFGDALVGGPMALDLALSAQAATSKGFQSPVAGNADILITPDIESGNVLFKSLNTLLSLDVAGVVVGSSVPIVVPSRGDSAHSKLLSMALAVHLTTTS
ncbi:bifunctional enoyl-CoA hydratase/phosphate acetyltransferase [Desulfonatronum thioautotrophicum]|uniref:bifunctional enoyl-CoA hydratase/phosphate acetyltransferase n=1 Tax=Desulfonatronum thioautotrophicum TaxID=617001 RepID=UPI0005EB60EA|nr:bifunctional enoyl-CoA hydratase/phosphate acetyltransferase [Desulfonatronum thioautotrophicum]